MDGEAGEVTSSPPPPVTFVTSYRESPSPIRSVRGFRVSSKCCLLCCCLLCLFPAVMGGYRRYGVKLFGILRGVIVRGLIVQALRSRGRTLRLGLNQLRVFFRVVHAQTVPLCRALLRI